MNYVVDKVKEEQKEDVSILTHPLNLIICERNTGVEPASQAWEARALPMC